MKKALSIILAILILLGITVSFGWKMVPNFISKKLSKEMGVSVEILSISNPFSEIGVQGITVGNPPRSILKKALSVKTLATDMKLFDVFDKKLIIDHIDINDIYLGLEFESKQSTQGNWTTIIGNLEGASQPKPDKKQSSSSKAVLIKELTLRNIHVDLVYKTNPKNIISLKPIDHIVIKNVGSDEGNVSEQIAQIVLRELLRNVLTVQNLQNMLENVLVPKKEENWFKTFKGVIKPKKQ